MLTRTSEHALRALIYLAQHADSWPIPGNEIAARAGIPPKYLSAVLSTLVREGILESVRGKRGGFSMARTPKQTRLIDVLAPFEEFGNRRCPFGDDSCDDANPCAAHDAWKKVVAAEQHFLRNTSVHAIAVKKNVSRRKRQRRRKT